MNPADLNRATESGSKDYCWDCKHWIWDCTCEPQRKMTGLGLSGNLLIIPEQPMPDGLDCPVAPMEGEE